MHFDHDGWRSGGTAIFETPGVPSEDMVEPPYLPSTAADGGIRRHPGLKRRGTSGDIHRKHEP